MARGKKSFVLYCDLIDVIDHLTTLEKGKLFEHLLDYVNDKKPVLDDRMLLGTWKHIEQSLKRDLVKYEKSAERSRQNGALGGRPKTHNNPEEPSGLIDNPDEPRKPDSVTVTDTVTVTDIVNKNNIINTTTEKINFSDLLEFINSTLGKSYKVINSTVKGKYNARLKDGYVKKDFMTAIVNASKDKYHKEKNYKYLTVEYFSRIKTLDLHCEEIKVKNKTGINI